MTDELSKRERELNKIIKLDPKLKAPIKTEYQTLAKNGDSVEEYTEIPEMKIMGKISGPFKDYKTSYIENEKGNAVIDIQEIENKKLIMESTKAFFGIPFHMEDQLLYRISDEAYASGEINDGHGNCLMDTIEVYNNWLLLCKNIDAIKSYIELACPDFDKRQKEYKKQFKKLSEELPHVEFFHILTTFFDHYTLAQIRKAKIDTLIDTGLPNIGKNEAKKIVIMLEDKKKFHSN